MGLLTDRINNKLERSYFIIEHALNPEPVPVNETKAKHSVSSFKQSSEVQAS